MAGSVSATTLGYIAVATAAVGAGVSAYSSVASGENAKETADYNAKVQQNSALDAQQRGAVASAEHSQKVRRMIANQLASASANGLMANTGTPLDIMTDTAGMGKLDSLRLLNNAGREAQGLNDQASILKIQGDNALVAGQLNAGGAILGGASQALNSYAKYKNTATYADSSATV
jgi:hypothetical protein